MFHCYSSSQQQAVVDEEQHPRKTMLIKSISISSNKRIRKPEVSTEIHQLKTSRPPKLMPKSSKSFPIKLERSNSTSREPQVVQNASNMSIMGKKVLEVKLNNEYGPDQLHFDQISTPSIRTTKECQQANIEPFVSNAEAKKPEEGASQNNFSISPPVTDLNVKSDCDFRSKVDLIIDCHDRKDGEARTGDEFNFISEIVRVPESPGTRLKPFLTNSGTMKLHEYKKAAVFSRLHVKQPSVRSILASRKREDSSRIKQPEPPTEQRPISAEPEPQRKVRFANNLIIFKYAPKI